MFKTNLSPLNPNKDKYLNSNYQASINDVHNTSNHQQTYQYKGMYGNINNVNYKQDVVSQQMSPYPQMAPLSPNINKNPMSPTAKIKMFSNTLTLNKKNSQNTNPLQPIIHQNTQQPNKLFNKMGGVKNLALNLNESMDLKCDQVLEETTMTNQYRKQTPQQPIKENIYGKRTGTKIPELNFQAQIDDLKCDEVLDIRKDNSHDDSKRHLRFNGNFHNNGPLSNADIQNNFTYTNMGNKNFQYQNGQKIHNIQAPTTPVYDKKKIVPLISMKKNTDRENSSNNNSNPSMNTVVNQTQHQKPRSFTNAVSPHIGVKHLHQQNNEQQGNNSSGQNDASNPSIEELDIERKYEEMMKLIERTKNVIQAYQREADQAKEKLNQARDKLNEAHQKNSFLQKQNMQLRKCLYEQGSNSGRTHAYGNNYPMTPGAARYQGVK